MIIKIKDLILKYWWIIPSIVILPVLYLAGRYLKKKDESKKMFEEYIKK